MMTYNKNILRQARWCPTRRIKARRLDLVESEGHDKGLTEGIRNETLITKRRLMIFVPHMLCQTPAYGSS